MMMYWIRANSGHFSVNRTCFSKLMWTREAKLRKRNNRRRRRWRSDFPLNPNPRCLTQLKKMASTWTTLSTCASTAARESANRGCRAPVSIFK